MMQRKLYIFCLAIVSLFSVNALAQKGKSEISLSYGYYSIYGLVNEPPYNVSSGIGLFNYKYYVSNRVTIGMGIGYENISNWGSFLSFTPEFTYSYLDTKDDRIRVRLYGGASIGLTVFEDFHVNKEPFSTNSDNTGAQFTGQLTPFGIRIGRKFAYYAEVGLGYKGLFNTGFSYRFRTKRKLYVEN